MAGFEKARCHSLEIPAWASNPVPVAADWTHQLCHNTGVLPAMGIPHLTIDCARLGDFCRKWKVAELLSFGSVLRDDFRPDSDVDVLVSFEPDAGWTLLDLISMQREIAEVLGRSVDLIEEAALRNPYRRSAILKSKQVVYAA